MRPYSQPQYLGYGVSTDLHFRGKEVRNESLSLPVITDLADLSRATGITQARIKWLCYYNELATVDHYSRFVIPKRNGDSRPIAKAKPSLAAAQKWIKTNILDQVPVAACVHGYVPGRSIRSNAEWHVSKPFVLRLDIDSFFESILFDKVKTTFRALGYNRGVSTILALLCTDSALEPTLLNGKRYYVAKKRLHLPQGACTSPALSNIIFDRVDRVIIPFAWKAQYHYTRYADDLFFSPWSDTWHSIGYVRQSVGQIVSKHGFSIADGKTAVLRGSRRQSVAGVVTNRKINVARSRVRDLRAALSWCEKYGLHDQMGPRLWGVWSFVRMLNPDVAGKLGNKYPWIFSMQGRRSGLAPMSSVNGVSIWKHEELGLALVDNCDTIETCDQDRWAVWIIKDRMTYIVNWSYFTARAIAVEDLVVLRAAVALRNSHEPVSKFPRRVYHFDQDSPIELD